MFFKKNKQIEELKQADEPMFMGRPYGYWLEIHSHLEVMNINDLLPHCVMENIELKKQNVILKKENEALSEALNKIIKGDTNRTNS